MTDQPDQFALIDRLAVGELDEAARRELFAWLDGEPLRWRRCAFALIESRELEHAFDDWQAEVPRPAVKLTRQPDAQRPNHSALFVLAASILIAFSLGIFARGHWAVPAPMIVELPKPAGREAPLEAASKESSTGIVKQPVKAPEKDVTTVAAAAPNAAQSDLIPPYVRSQLERRGYQLTSHPARLPVVFPDGRRVMLPVDQLHLNYVGQRTY